MTIEVEHYVRGQPGIIYHPPKRFVGLNLCAAYLLIKEIPPKRASRDGFALKRPSQYAFLHFTHFRITSTFHRIDP